ncbi:MAG TPA: integrase arm-type DNA-binding domain-containing protein [Burkholderiales bacterium]|nr:integrase arm-type DNA-binding domain-containing protein [Burkholderiales bacterium]
MLLTDIRIRGAKPDAKTMRLFDGGGLYLEIAPSGGKWWRFKYRFDGKEKRVSLGVYPTIGLKDARLKHGEARKQLANGIDPGAQRKAQKASSNEQAANTFAVIAREWIERNSPKWGESYSKKIVRRLEVDLFPRLRSRPLAGIKAHELLVVLRKVESRGAIETAHRCMQYCSQIFRYAVATGRAERDPTFDLRGALTSVKQKHRASITDPKEVGELMRAIDGYQGSPVTKIALQLAPLTFVRPGELRGAEWAEFDLEDGKEWRISAHRMKMREQHVVPLSKQALALLKELRLLTGHSRYLFPGVRNHDRSMSENTITAALRRLDYEKGEMTGHGFRSMASTLLNEQGWNRDAIERQLAHAERSEVRAAYNYAEYLPERRKMMQAWADYLDRLKVGAKIHDFPRKTA